MPKLSLLYYFTPKGRVSRSQFWLYFQLPILAFGVVATALVLLQYPHIFDIVGDPQTVNIEAAMTPRDNPIFTILGAITQIIQIPLAVISIFGVIRRYHDRNKSGWWMFIGLIPLFGTIWFYVETGFLKGTTGPNRFGPDPLEKQLDV